MPRGKTQLLIGLRRQMATKPIVQKPSKIGAVMQTAGNNFMTNMKTLKTSFANMNAPKKQIGMGISKRRR